MTASRNNVANKGAPLRITDIGHSTMLIELGGETILTDPWFSDPAFGLVTHPHGLGMDIDEMPELSLIVISHAHFDHCDLKSMSRLNKSAVVIVPDGKIEGRVKKLGYKEVTVLAPWESRLVSRVSVTALPGDHVVPECTYLMSYADKSVYFGGDTRYVKELKEIGEKFDVTVALLPVNGLSFPFVGRVVMDSVDAAEAAIQLKARVVIPIHHNISLSIPFLKGLFERSTHGTPEQFAQEVRRRNRHIKVVTLNPGETWQTD